MKRSSSPWVSLVARYSLRTYTPSLAAGVSSSSSWVSATSQTCSPSFTYVSGILHRRTFRSSSAVRADIFAQTLDQAEETLKTEVKEEKKKEEKVTEVKYYELDLNAGRKRIGPLLKQIRGLSYREAIVQLTFSPLRIAPKVKQAIEKCRERAEKANLNPDRLLVSSLYATRGHYGQPKPEFKAKGRVGIRRRQRSHVFVSLKEIPYVEGEKKLGKFARGVNKGTRLQWEKRVQAAAQALDIHPLFITTREVKKWEYEQEKKAKAAKLAAQEKQAQAQVQAQQS